MNYTPEQIAQFASLPFDQIPQDALGAVLAYMKAENNKLSQYRGANGITLRVSAKGAVSVYGLGRFPITIYKGQWEKLLSDDSVRSIREFIAANESKLAVKPAKGDEA